MAFIFSFGLLADNLECASEAGDFSVQINQDKLNGHIVIEEMCILLQCMSSEDGYECQGFHDDKAYYVTYMGSKGGFVNRVTAMNFDLIGYMQCSKASEAPTTGEMAIR